MKMEFDKNVSMNIKIRAILQLIFFIGSMFAVVFLSAGRWDYWQGWLYFLLWVFIHSYNFVFISPELIKERTKINAGTKKWDIVIYIFIALLGYIVPLIASLDGGRYHWTGNFLIWINALAFVLMFLGSCLFIYGMQVNRFFSATVRIQKDRGQFVIDKGPYAFIRHPGYASMIVSYLASGFALNSIWALIPAGLLVIVFIIRTYLEDVTLQKELPGYKEYAARVRYRLAPGIW